MASMVPILIGLLVVFASVGYVLAEPYFQSIPTRVFKVSLELLQTGLGGDLNITGSIDPAGLGSVMNIQVSNLVAVPPVHSYLVMKAGSFTTYAVVFWTGSTSGAQYASFARLQALVSSPGDPVSFFYSSSFQKDIPLGTH